MLPLRFLCNVLQRSLPGTPFQIGFPVQECHPGRDPCQTVHSCFD